MAGSFAYPDRADGDGLRKYASVRIPVKWGTDSGECGPASESQTQGKAMMREVDHFSQEECSGMAESASFRFHHFVS
jgi:hypothetical protein